jgi:hypothetical protein
MYCVRRSQLRVPTHTRTARFGRQAYITYDVCCKHVNSADIHPSPRGDPTDETHPPCCPTLLACDWVALDVTIPHTPLSSICFIPVPTGDCSLSAQACDQTNVSGHRHVAGARCASSSSNRLAAAACANIAWRRAAAVPVSQDPCCWIVAPAAHPDTRQLVDTFTCSSHQDNHTAHNTQSSHPESSLLLQGLVLPCLCRSRYTYRYVPTTCSCQGRPQQQGADEGTCT